MDAAPTDYKVAIDLVRQLLVFAREHGLPVEQLMAQHAIDLDPLPGQPAYLSGRLVERLLAAAMPLLPDELPGLLVGRAPKGAMFGLASFLVQTSSTLGAVLHTVTQVEPLIGDTGITRLRHEPGEVHLHWQCRFTDPYVHHHVTDFIFCMFAWGIGLATTSHTSLIRSIHFAHPSPDDPKQVKRYIEMFGCPVYFDQPEHRIVLPASALELPLASADPELHEVLQLHAQKMLKERRNEISLADLARSRLHQLIHLGTASKETLAEALHMSGRTLQRRLGDAGTSYRELFDELRLERARILLRDSSLTVQQIAERTGFDEHNSFTRWFRQLTGFAPSEFRQKLSEHEQ